MCSYSENKAQEEYWIDFCLKEIRGGVALTGQSGRGNKWAFTQYRTQKCWKQDQDFEEGEKKKLQNFQGTTARNPTEKKVGGGVGGGGGC